MTIKEFCEEYNKFATAELKAKCMKDVMKRVYCPIAEKYSILKAMFDKSVIEQQNGLKYVDSWVFRLNLSMAIIAMYTTLTADNNENDIFENYDLIIQNNIIDMIKIAIGEGEIGEIEEVCTDIRDNFEQQNSIRNLTLSMIEKYSSLFMDTFTKEMNNAMSKLEDDTKRPELISKLQEVFNAK